MAAIGVIRPCPVCGRSMADMRAGALTCRRESCRRERRRHPGRYPRPDQRRPVRLNGDVRDRNRQAPAERYLVGPSGPGMAEASTAPDRYLLDVDLRAALKANHAMAARVDELESALEGAVAPLEAQLREKDRRIRYLEAQAAKQAEAHRREVARLAAKLAACAAETSRLNQAAARMERVKDRTVEREVAALVPILMATGGPAALPAGLVVPGPPVTGLTGLAVPAAEPPAVPAVATGDWARLLV